MEAEDLSLAEFEQLLARDTSLLEPEVRATYERYATSPVRMLYSWKFGEQLVTKSIWVIARAGSHVIGYDEVEEEYGTGTVLEEGTVVDWGTYGELLRWTLLRFPEDHFGGPRLGDARPLV
jgi:hypothetical protein